MRSAANNPPGQKRPPFCICRSVKISLFYNKAAGDGISLGELQERLKRAGYDVVRSLGRDDDTSALAEQPSKLVVAAGGDGTIAAAAKAVAGSNIPLAILPLGTANNIAKSLGINGALPELIESWRHAIPVPFDLGEASANGQTFAFVEGIGGGLIPSGISAADEAGDEDDETATEVRVADAICHFRDVLIGLKPTRFTLKADGADMSGDYLVVEVLNIGCVGPNIEFSPGVTPSDGLLSVVTAGEEYRDELLSYLDERMAGKTGHLSLPATLATNVEIGGRGNIHLDDRNRKAKALGNLSLRIQPAALSVLNSPAT